MYRRLLLASVGAIALAGTAFAADLPVHAPPPVYVPPAPIFTWTGFYLGGHIGYAWGTNNSTFTDAFGDYASFGRNSDGAVGGGHIGYNLQFNQFVIGLEGDVDGSAINESVSRLVLLDAASGDGLLFPINAGVSYGLQASIRGRVGYAWDRVLIYATGGVAFAELNAHLQTILGYDSVSNTRTGWTIGGGIEYAISNNWSVRAEYRYAQFGHSTLVGNSFFGIESGLLGANLSRTVNENRVNVGFSYKFELVPVVRCAAAAAASADGDQVASVSLNEDATTEPGWQWPGSACPRIWQSAARTARSPGLTTTAKRPARRPAGHRQASHLLRGGC